MTWVDKIILLEWILIFQKLKELLVSWPSNIYSLTSIDQLVRLQINDERPDKILLECSAIM
jgi:hypothetical protein